VTEDVTRLLKEFESVGDRESETAFFRTHVPWLGSLAYLNVVFKPPEAGALFEVSTQLGMPDSLVRFLKLQNGAILFSESLSVYGVHEPGQLLRRREPFLALPFNILLENSNWPPHDVSRYLAIGGYGFDGSTGCIDRRDESVVLFPRGPQALLPDPSLVWPGLETWLSTEIDRLSALFDRHGRRLVDEGRTVPS
jgi:hypothetical protein